MIIYGRPVLIGLPVLVAIMSGIAGGAIINVPANGNLQAALNAAQPGDTITLAPGAVYKGNFTLPAKTGSQYVTITTSQPSTLPAEGQRIGATNFSSLPKIVAPNSASAIATESSAAHYMLRGLEVTVASGVYAMDLISLETTNQQDLSTYATDIVIDQCYIHGDPSAGGKRGIAMNGINVVVKNSYLSNFKSHTQDAQAICDWYGPGPFQIVNNYLEGGQGILFGGAAPQKQNLVPSNIQITSNYFSRPMAWKGVWPVKNQLELKNAQNVTISDNIFENNWISAQNGYAVLFTVRTCEAGNYPWAVVKNVTMTYNLMRNSDFGINILGTDNVRQSCPPPAVAGLTSNVVIQNNLFEINTGFMELLSGAQYVKVDHNTVIQQGDIMGLDGTPQSSNFTFTNNITFYGPYGVVGTDTRSGTDALNKYVNGYTYVKNVAADSPANIGSTYPAGNFFPTTVAQVGFQNFQEQQYQLAANSPYKNAGTDGKDIGADVLGVLAATGNVMTGRTTTMAP